MSTEPHKFKGREDRPCEECNLPDRDPIHKDAQGHDLRITDQVPTRPTRFSEMAFWEKAYLVMLADARVVESSESRGNMADASLAEWLKRWGEPEKEKRRA